ncbi:hypothetical protein IAD21_05190 [Abditibacteriota bacterium]|nr:hypothetical protein IAD21_05190 [Abditibacteriota bacterium]
MRVLWERYRDRNAIITVKIPTSFRIAVLSTALPLALMMGNVPSQAQPKTKAKAALGAKPPKKGNAVKHAEEVLGKPLTPTQIAAVRAAQKERQKAMKPIQDKFKAKVAKALGLTVAQYEAREKALRDKKDHKK